MTLAVGGWSIPGKDASGNVWYFDDLQGFEDLPAVRVDFPDRAGADGSFDAVAHSDKRIVTFSGLCQCPDVARMAAAKNTLRGAAGSMTTGLDLAVTIDGVPFVLHGKRADAWKIDPVGKYSFRFQGNIVCPDPRKYSPSLHSASANLVDTSAGTGAWQFPMTFPYGFSPGAGAGLMTVTNAGAVTSYPVFTLYGPGTALLLSDQASGNYLKISSLSAGQYVVLDTLNKAVLLMGNTSRRDLLTAGSRWFGLPPGLDVISLTASVFTAASVSMTWRDAWM